MQLPINREGSRAAVEEAAEALRGFHGMPLITELANLLDSLVVHYRVLLSTAPIAEVPALQAALLQCSKLRAGLARDGEPPFIS